MHNIVRGRRFPEIRQDRATALSEVGWEFLLQNANYYNLFERINEVILDCDMNQTIIAYNMGVPSH